MTSIQQPPASEKAASINEPAQIQQTQSNREENPSRQESIPEANMPQQDPEASPGKGSTIPEENLPNPEDSPIRNDSSIPEENLPAADYRASEDEDN